MQGSLVTIPTGAKTLKVEVVPGRWHHHLRQAGFITRYPKVARATLCLPGRDPSKLVPVVHRANGKRVGCRVVWAQADHAEPMTIMFDSSSGDEEYWVYLVDQAKAPAALEWTPQVELIQEIRQLDRYNPELKRSLVLKSCGAPLPSWEEAFRGSGPARALWGGSSRHG